MLLLGTVLGERSGALSPMWRVYEKCHSWPGSKASAPLPSQQTTRTLAQGPSRLPRSSERLIFTTATIVGAETKKNYDLRYSRPPNARSARTEQK